MLKFIISLHSKWIHYPSWWTSQFIPESANLAVRQCSFFIRQQRNSWTRCNRCGHRCNIFMLWTGRVRAINSGDVGRVKEERDETRVGGSSWGREGEGGRAITFPKPLGLSRDRVTGTTIHHRFASYNPRADPQPVRPRVSSRASSHRTLYGAWTTLFVCFQPVCARTRRYAILVSGMRVTGRTTDARVLHIGVRTLTGKRKDYCPLGKSAKCKPEERWTRESLVKTRFLKMTVDSDCTCGKL